jgi:hypothetical protein
MLTRETCLMRGFIAMHEESGRSQSIHSSEEAE